jgi:hypothetical protein
MALPPSADDLEDQDSYELLLLDDHPLRSYPTQCCPGLRLYLRAWYATVRKNWGERIFRIVCLLLMSLYVIILIGCGLFCLAFLAPAN